MYYICWHILFFYCIQSIWLVNAVPSQNLAIAPLEYHPAALSTPPHTVLYKTVDVARFGGLLKTVIVSNALALAQAVFALLTLVPTSIAAHPGPDVDGDGVNDIDGVGVNDNDGVLVGVTGGVLGGVLDGVLVGVTGGVPGGVADGDGVGEGHNPWFVIVNDVLPDM